MNTTRRELKFSTADDVAHEVRTLRAKGYDRAGQWSLAQACAHLDVAMQVVLAPPPHPDTTPEQEQNRPILESILANGKMADGLIAPAPFVPTPATTDAAIDSFLATLEKFKTHAGPFAPHRRFGKLPDDIIRQLQMLHCAHHLGFLSPRQ